MNDKIIINTISKIHFILVSALTFIFLLLFSIFVLLQNGIYLDDVSLPNLKVKKLYIKWNEKISVVIKEINIIKTKNKTNIDYNKVIKDIEKNLIFSNWFELIKIEKILFNDITGYIEYKDNKRGSLSLSSPQFSLDSLIYARLNTLQIKINKLNIKQKKIDVSGKILFKLKDGLKFSSSLNIDINNDANITLNIHGDNKKLTYAIDSNKKIEDARYIIDLIEINPKVKYWFYDAMTLSSLSIKSVNGWLDYENIDKAYLNLKAKAVATNLIYTYDKLLPPIRTSHTNLEFKDGILFIKPQDAYTYDFFLDKSWLKIDFSKKEELLTLYLLFKGQANKDLLSLLNRYKINLPFVQTEGDLDANLKLLINLRTDNVDAIGDFYTREAKINYLGLDLDIFNAHVFLKNTHVKVNDMLTKYKEIASANVDLNFNAKESKGKLDFRINKVFFKENNLRLENNFKPLNASYIISPKQDKIKFDKSIWVLNNEHINIDAVNMQFNLKTLSVKLPITSLSIKNKISAKASGEILLKPMRLDLNIDILNFKYANINLKQSKLPLKLLYNEELSISTKEIIRLNINSKEYRLSNAALNIKNNIFSINNIKLISDDMLKSNVSAKYDIVKTSGYIDIHNIDFKYKKLGNIFKSDKNIALHISKKYNITKIESKEYDIDYKFNIDEWTLKLNSLEKIVKNSEILQEYNFDNGYFSIFKKSNEQNIKFLADTNYKYKILTTKNKVIDNYVIKGEIDKNNNDIFFNINSSVDVKIADDIEIYAHDIGINIDEITDMLRDKNGTKSVQEKKNISFDAKNCFLFLSKHRHILSENITLQYANNILIAKLKHKKGEANYELKNGKFILYGKDFGDIFMKKLFSLSKFKGGSFRFSISGTTAEYSGIAYAKDTIIVEYKILNNVLAFVNTIPSLVTFSLPGYSNKGLKAKSAYINFSFRDDIYTMSNIFLNSKEIDIIGKGTASIKNNTIDLDLNLKTDLGSKVSKIPVVGYILMGEDSISTSLTVKGSLDNPKVDTQVAKSIIVAPFNIIKRTLLFPFELFKRDDKDK
ncbi:MAG: AsmA-like C-terminal domain-containing protein [Sulfurimonas sp.]|nr:AsmA-like C-terminal domain-containing protein [Sulfurimonas sp.]